ncbi:Uncharacterised protein [Acinetobacter baumannii]|nr:Uncharacterised protein [Acinetobacter baumannii]
MPPRMITISSSPHSALRALASHSRRLTLGMAGSFLTRATM